MFLRGGKFVVFIFSLIPVLCVFIVSTVFHLTNIKEAFKLLAIIFVMCSSFMCLALGSLLFVVKLDVAAAAVVVVVFVVVVAVVVTWSSVEG